MFKPHCFAAGLSDYNMMTVIKVDARLMTHQTDLHNSIAVWRTAWREPCETGQWVWKQKGAAADLCDWMNAQLVMT